MRRASIVLPWTAAAVAFEATAWHIARNLTPPAYDDAWYMETSFRLWMALKASPLAFAREYLSAFRFKAPLISLTPLPLYILFGTGERIAVWTNLPLAILAAWAWSRAASAWWKNHPRRHEIAALSGALAALLPFSYGLARVFMVETLLSALLGLFAWRCAAAKKDDRAEGARLGVLLGLGLLAKVTFPMLAAGFIWPARERLRPHAKTALIVGGLIAATWYMENLPFVARFAWSAGFGSVARDYAGGGGLGARLDWLGGILRDGFSWPLALSMAAVGAAVAAVSKDARPDAGTKAVLWGLLPLLVFAAGVNRETRFTAPLLPLLSALAARAAVSFERPARRALAAALLLGVGLVVCLQQTFFVDPGQALAYNGRPSRDPGWDRDALIDAIVRAAGPSAVAAIALEHHRLNANNLSSKAAERGLPLRFINLGYAQSSLENALIRLKDKDASVLVFVKGVPAGELPPFLNRVNSDVADAVKSGRLPARETARAPLAPGIEAVVWSLR